MPREIQQKYFAHDSAWIDQPCEIGKGTKIWHFCHVMSGALLGPGCNLGQNVFLTAPYLVLFPAGFLSVTVLAFIMLGDALRDALDPKRN